MSGFNCRKNEREYIKIVRAYFNEERNKDRKINKGSVN